MCYLKIINLYDVYIYRFELELNTIASGLTITFVSYVACKEIVVKIEKTKFGKNLLHLANVKR